MQSVASYSKKSPQLERFSRQFADPAIEAEYIKSKRDFLCRRACFGLGFGIVVYLAIAFLDYFRLGWDQLFQLTVVLRLSAIAITMTALLAVRRMGPSGTTALLMLLTALWVAGVNFTMIRLGAQNWLEFGAAVAAEIVFFAVFLPMKFSLNVTAGLALIVTYLAAGIGLVDGDVIVRSTLVLTALLFISMVFVRRRSELSRESFYQQKKLSERNLHLEHTIEENAIQRQALEQAASQNVALADELSLLREDAELYAIFLNVVIDNIAQGVTVFDKELKLVAWNNTVVEMLRYPAGFLKHDLSMEEIVRFNATRGEYGAGDPEVIVAEKMAEVTALDEIEAHSYERQCGEGRYVEVSGKPLPGGGLVTTYTDITERRHREDSMRKRAEADALTGLANRGAFDEALARAFGAADQAGHGMALAILDLDGFKPVNDTFGHIVGDTLLCYVARILTSTIRDTDFAARIGGDEFAIIFPKVENEAAAHGPISRIIDAVTKPIPVDGNNISIGVSVGISYFPDDARTVDQLREHADQALYQAKSEGKGRYRVAASA